MHVALHTFSYHVMLLMCLEIVRLCTSFSICCALYHKKIQERTGKGGHSGYLVGAPILEYVLVCQSMIMHHECKECLCNGHTAKEQKMGLLRNATLVGDDGPAVGGDAFITNLIISTGLVLIAGCMAGATMNLTGLDPLRLYLRVLAREGDENFAKRAHSVTKDPHLLLVTLLLCNAAANEALPIFLGRIVDPMLAIIISVTCVLFFGEIIPSAICLNPSTQLRIAACSAPFVKVLIWLCYPLAWPIAKLLDRLLPHGGVDRLSLKELTYLVMLQSRRDRQRGVMLSPTKGKNSVKPASVVTPSEAAPGAAAAKSSKTRYGTAAVAASIRTNGSDADNDPPVAPDGIRVTRASRELCSSGRGTHVQRRRRLRRVLRLPHG